MFQVTGVDQLQAALQQMAARVQVATPRAVKKGTTLLEDKTKASLVLKSHRRGTPTPSLPGEPPAKISGALRDSVVSTPPARLTDAWISIVGPTTVYSRIQELGGWAGRGHRSYLPPRPYLRPAAEALAKDPAFREVFVRLWGTAIKG